MRASNNTPVKIYGSKILDVNLNTLKSFPWTFKVADVRFAVLGCDFLTYYGLRVDLKNKCIIDPDPQAFIAKTNASPHAIRTPQHVPSFSEISSNNSILHTQPVDSLSHKNSPLMLDGIVLAKTLATADSVTNATSSNNVRPDSAENHIAPDETTNISNDVHSIAKTTHDSNPEVIRNSGISPANLVGKERLYKNLITQLHNKACTADVSTSCGQLGDILISDYADVFSSTIDTNKVKHNVEHHIVTHGPPVKSKVRRLSPEKLAFVKEEINQLLEDDILSPSSSPYASAIHIVPKSETGKFRMVGDYRALNVSTQPDRYPLPYLNDFADVLHECTVFTKLDCLKGYHQIPMAKNDIHKTAITTPIGLYEYNMMPFGLRNASNT